eukprot:6460153-Lingulodinium_polyedra.AAC.1
MIFILKAKEEAGAQKIVREPADLRTFSLSNDDAKAVARAVAAPVNLAAERSVRQSVRGGVRG